MRKSVKAKGAKLTGDSPQEEAPDVAELFVISARQTIELAGLLGMTRDDFVRTLQMGWDVVDEQSKAAAAAKESTT